MRKTIFGIGLVLASLLFFPAEPALAGAKIQITDDTKIDLGFRLQTLYLHTETDLDGDGKFEDEDDFNVRRARIRLGADITKWASMFLQTEFAEESTAANADARIIDAFIRLKPHKLANIYLGENMAPVLRQNLTSSGALLAVDRPAIVYKNLTWGTRALAAFINKSFDDSDAGLRGDVDVRDMGATLFGSTSLTDMAHIKYYLGVYDGVQESDEDNERFAGRVQVNFFDSEPGYYNLSTYLGKKKTIGLGAAYDTQSEVDVDTTGKSVDYRMWTVDAFTEYPVGPGQLSFEVAYIDLDLDDAGILDSSGKSAKNSQGDGYYAQAGYLIENVHPRLDNWQPWIEYEDWSSDGSTGSFDNLRIGLTYFIKGHNANIKVGYEIFDADKNFSGTNEDSIETFVTGLYVTY